MTAVTSPVEAPVPGASPGSGSGPGAGAAGRRKKKPVERFSVARTLRYALLILFVLIVLVPVYVLFVTSFKGPGDAAPTGPARSRP